MQIKNTDEFFSWVSTTAVPAFWPDHPTPNEPIGAMRIKQIRIDDD
jgi:hypothetical protein